MTLLTHLFITLILFTFNVQNNNWEKEFEKGGITVYTKIIEGSELKAFRGEMEIEATIDKLTAILMDIERFPNWCYRTSSTKLIKREDEAVYYYYLSKTPAILKNREAYFCNEIIRDSLTKTVTVAMNTYNSDEPLSDGCLRIPFSNGTWELIPISDYKTKIIFQVHAGPGGIIPSWFVNIIAVESPWVTLDNIRKLIAED